MLVTLVTEPDLSPYLVDEEGRVRGTYRVQTLHRLVEGSVGEILHHAKDSPRVRTRLAEVAHKLAEMAAPDHRPTIATFRASLELDEQGPGESGVSGRVDSNSLIGLSCLDLAMRAGPRSDGGDVLGQPVSLDIEVGTIRSSQRGSVHAESPRTAIGQVGAARNCVVVADAPPWIDDDCLSTGFCRRHVKTDPLTAAEIWPPAGS